MGRLRASFLALVLGVSGAGAVATVLGAGCSSFSASDTADAGDGSTATTPDAAAPQADAGPPCADSTTVVFGPASLDLAARSNDYLKVQYRDAHQFVARGPGSARCAWLYIVTAPNAGAVHFGVYADKGGAPATLLARARFDRPTAGWNKTPLDVTLPIQADAHLWIVFGPESDTMEVSSTLDASCSPNAFSGVLDPGVDLADPFSGGERPQTCNVAAYLGP